MQCAARLADNDALIQIVSFSNLTEEIASGITSGRIRLINPIVYQTSEAHPFR